MAIRKKVSNVESIYTSYRCKRCKKEMILIAEEERQTLKEGHYISCSHCGSKHVVKETTTDNLKELISEGHIYKRKHGAMVQIV